MNPMKDIRLEKIVVNIGAGEAGPKLEKSKKLLETLTNKKVVTTQTHKRTTFGTPKKRPIGVKVTLRGDDAVKFLKKAFHAVESRLKPSQFDTSGNFSFGIAEYIHMQGVKYDPDIGILGMDVCVTLKRPGFRIRKRSIRPKKIGKSHLIKPKEAIEWVQKQFGVTVSEVSE